MQSLREREIEEQENLLEVDLHQTHPKWKIWKRIDWKNINWPFWKEILLVLTTLFVAESSRGLMVPSLFLYVEDNGGNKKSLGMVVAGYSVGRLFGSVVFGWWYNKRGGKEVLIFSLLISIFGNFAYSFAPLTGWWIILVSRSVVGLGSGILSVVRACIADITTVEQRTRFMAYSSAVQFLGFAIVPGIAGVLTYIDFRVGSLDIDQFTSAGFLLALINFLMMIVIIIWYPNRKPVTLEHVDSSTKSKSKKDASSSIPQSMYWIGALVFIALNFVARGVLALLETTGAPVFMDAWSDDDGDSVKDTSNMMLLLGLGGLVIFALIDWLEKYIAEHWLLSASFLMIGSGGLFLFDYTGNGVSLAQFIIGASLIWSIGSPIAQTIILSAFSKILGSKPQGEMMGWIGSAGSVGRIVFPLLGGFLGNNPSFLVSAITSFLSAISVLVYTWMIRKAKAKALRDSLFINE